MDAMSVTIQTVVLATVYHNGENAMEQKTMEIEECMENWLREITAQKGTEIIPMEQCTGRIAAEDVLVSELVPPFPKSAMDGYAVRAEDVIGATPETPVYLKVIGELCAGDYAEIPYQDKSCIRIMTGAFIPEGFDAVVKQEDTDYSETVVRIDHGVKSFQNYCRPGEDMKPGDVICKQYEKITPLQIGLMASLGMQTVRTLENIKVSVISTGSELLNIDEQKVPGKIYNSISYILKASIEKEGFQVLETKICRDNTEELVHMIKNAVDHADIVITTGGVSVGKKDLLPEVLDFLGAKTIFTRANIQPGTPTIGSVLHGKPILSLSGNPYAAIANFEFYFWQLAGYLLHTTTCLPTVTTAILKTEYPKKNKLRRWIRAYAENGFVTIPSEIHASSVISNMTGCNCFIDLPEGKQVQVGDLVKIRMFQ